MILVSIAAILVALIILGVEYWPEILLLWLFCCLAGGVTWGQIVFESENTNSCSKFHNAEYIWNRECRLGDVIIPLFPKDN